MSSLVDQISPPYIGAKRFSLSLESPLLQATARRQIALSVSYDAAYPEQAVPPLAFTVQAPTASGWVERFYSIAPGRLVFTPIEGGLHSVTLRELYHNRWWGNLVIKVEGERLGK